MPDTAGLRYLIDQAARRLLCDLSIKQADASAGLPFGGSSQIPVVPTPRLAPNAHHAFNLTMSGHNPPGPGGMRPVATNAQPLRQAQGQAPTLAQVRDRVATDRARGIDVGAAPETELGANDPAVARALQRDRVTAPASHLSTANAQADREVAMAQLNTAASLAGGLGARMVGAAMTPAATVPGQLGRLAARQATSTAISNVPTTGIGVVAGAAPP